MSRAPSASRASWGASAPPSARRRLTYFWSRPGSRRPVCWAERGVDPSGQVRAIERATALLLAIAGGEAGPVVVTEESGELPTRPAVSLRRERLARLLGVTVPESRVGAIFRQLQMKVTTSADGW